MIFTYISNLQSRDKFRAGSLIPRQIQGKFSNLLILIVLLGFGLRIYQLDSFSFWQDEGLTSRRSGYSVHEILSNHIIIQEGITNDTHPAFYYLLIHFTRQLWGESDFAFRYLSVLAGTLLIPVGFQLMRVLTVGPFDKLRAGSRPIRQAQGRPTTDPFDRLRASRQPQQLASTLNVGMQFGFIPSLLVALLLAINPVQIWYAQEARMYPVLVLLVAVGSLCLYGKN